MDSMKGIQVIHLICESNDNACKTQLLLDSIEKYIPDTFNISIMYNHSSIDFAKGYNLLKKRFKNINFIPSVTDFYENILYLVCTSNDHIAFCGNNTVVYKKSPKTFDKLEAYLPKFDTECFSFRLGLNTIVQNPRTGELQPVLNRYINRDNIICWNRSIYHTMTNYGYSFSMDMHVYRREILKYLIKQITFSNFMQLESKLLEYNNKILYMSSFEKSIAVSLTNEVDPYSINDKYLNGEVISFINDKVIGCHQEFPLEFEQYNG